MEKSSLIAFLIWKSAWHHVRTSMDSPHKISCLKHAFVVQPTWPLRSISPCKNDQFAEYKFCCVHCGPYRARSWDRFLLLTLQMGKHCKNNITLSVTIHYHHSISCQLPVNRVVLTFFFMNDRSVVEQALDIFPTLESIHRASKSNKRYSNIVQLSQTIFKFRLNMVSCPGDN